ncbi:MAG: hypothetical protein EOM20_18890 [Spartobacteria bacterium]|nr:hypothetical protein [Spartobacteria bacterium]
MKKLGLLVYCLVAVSFFLMYEVVIAFDVSEVLEASIGMGDREPAPVVGWSGGSDHGYLFRLDSAITHRGKYSARLQSRPSWQSGFGCLTQEFSARDFLGQTIRYRAYVKTSNVVESCGMWMRIDDVDMEVVGFDNMYDRAITGTTEWTQYEIKMPVPHNSETILIGLLLEGEGVAWIDDIEITGDGIAGNAMETWIMSNDRKEYPRNLDFEGEENDDLLNAGLTYFPKGKNGYYRDVDSRPRYWQFGGTSPEAFTFIADSNTFFEGSFCARIDSSPSCEKGYGTLHQSFRARVWHGRTLALRAQIMASNLTGMVSLWIRADDKRGTALTFDSLEKQGTPITAATDGWQSYAVSILIPQDAFEINAGILLHGQGTVWMDDLQLNPIPPTGTAMDDVLPEMKLANMDFEDGPESDPMRVEAQLYKVVNVPAWKPAPVLLTNTESWVVEMSGGESLTAGDWNMDDLTEILISDISGRLTALDTAGRTVSVFNLSQRFTQMEFGHAGQEPRLLGYVVWATNTAPAIDCSLIHVLFPDGSPAWKYEALAAVDGAHWVDVNADGFDEMIIGNNGNMGLSLVNSDGKLIWRYNGIGNVWNQAAVKMSSDGDILIGATAADGYIHLFNSTGEPLRAYQPEDFTYSSLYGCQAENGTAQFLSIAVTSFEIDYCLYGVGMWLAVDQDGNECWRAPVDYGWGMWRERMAVAGDFNNDGINEWALFDGAHGVSIVSLSGQVMWSHSGYNGRVEDLAYVPLEEGGALAVLEGGRVHYYAFD